MSDSQRPSTEKEQHQADSTVPTRDPPADVASEPRPRTSRRRAPRPLHESSDTPHELSRSSSPAADVPSPPNHELALLRKEVSLLTAIVEKREPKLLIISSLAFVLSLGTALVSAYTDHKKDIHDEQRELATTLQQLQEMPEKTQDMMNKYKGTPMEWYLTGALSNQTTNLLYHARDLASELGSASPSSSLLAVAEALASQPDYEGATKLMELAIKNANNFIDEQGALRELGYLKVSVGDTPMIRSEGDALFEKAMGVATKYPDTLKQPWYLAYSYGWTESTWAAAWATADCAKSKEHLDEASKWAEKSGEGLLPEQLHRRIAGTQTTLDQACGKKVQPK